MTIEKLKRGEPSGSLRYLPVCQKQVRQPLVPVRSDIINKLTEHLFEGLIEALREPISLGIVWGGPHPPDAK